MPMQLDIGAIKAESRSLLRTGEVNPFRMTLFYLLITLVLDMINSGVSYMIDSAGGFTVLSFSFVSILVGLVALVLNAGYYCYCFGILRREEMPYESLFDAFPFAGKVILLSIVEGVFIFLWSMLFVIPGIIAAYRYSFAMLNLCENPKLGVMEALKLLPQSPDITVVTNSTEVFREFQQSPLNIISTGGEYNKKSLSLQGQLAKTNILKYNVSLALISCKGLSIEKGVLDSNESEAEVKKAMLSQAEEVALLVDFSKFDQSAFVNLIDLQKVNYIITDRSPSEKWIEYCSEQGIELIY